MTRSRVDSRTRGSLLSTRDTVLIATPAAAATSVIVFRLIPGFVLSTSSVCTGYFTAAMSTALRTDSFSQPRRVGWGFVLLYAAAYVGTWLALLTPIMVTLALKVQELAHDRAASALSL